MEVTFDQQNNAHCILKFGTAGLVCMTLLWRNMTKLALSGSTQTIGMLTT